MDMAIRSISGEVVPSWTTSRSPDEPSLWDPHPVPTGLVGSLCRIYSGWRWQLKPTSDPSRMTLRSSGAWSVVLGTAGV